MGHTVMYMCLEIYKKKENKNNKYKTYVVGKGRKNV